MKDKTITAICFGLVAVLLGAQLYIASHYRQPKVTLPTHEEIHKYDCNTCGCRNKADVLLIIDIGSGKVPVRQTLLCDRCYSEFVVDMAVPVSNEVLKERIDGR